MHNNGVTGNIENGLFDGTLHGRIINLTKSLDKIAAGIGRRL